jgi:hypothetical protein
MPTLILRYFAQLRPPFYDEFNWGKGKPPLLADAPTPSGMGREIPGHFLEFDF